MPTRAKRLRMRSRGQTGTNLTPGARCCAFAADPSAPNPKFASRSPQRRANFGILTLAYRLDASARHTTAHGARLAIRHASSGVASGFRPGAALAPDAQVLELLVRQMLDPDERV